MAEEKEPRTDPGRAGPPAREARCELMQGGRCNNGLVYVWRQLSVIMFRRLVGSIDKRGHEAPRAGARRPACGPTRSDSPDELRGCAQRRVRRALQRRPDLARDLRQARLQAEAPHRAHPHGRVALRQRARPRALALCRLLPRARAPPPQGPSLALHGQMLCFQSTQFQCQR